MLAAWHYPSKAREVPQTNGLPIGVSLPLMNAPDVASQAAPASCSIVRRL